MDNTKDFSRVTSPAMPPVQNGGVLSGGLPVVRQASTATNLENNSHALVKTVVIVILTLVSITFIGLFVWMFLQYDDAKSDVDYKIDMAVAVAKEEQANADAIRYQNEAKNPFRTFAGPVDYGQLTFLYPKTWSMYVAADAVNGGNYEAYFNPNQVNTVSNSTINALRLSIVNERYEDVVSRYQGELEGNPPALTVESVTIGSAEDGTVTTANRYVGKIPGTEFSGIIVIFKIRDKTAILRTDSMLFEQDFNDLVDTITFNG